LAILLLPALIGVLAVGAVGIAALWFAKGIAGLARHLAPAHDQRPKG
jgi:hypothetical protein